MNHGTTASLICPACGQPFLSMQHAMAGMTQCPHCAHTAPRAQFGTQSQVAGVAHVLRRVAQAPPPQAHGMHMQSPPQQQPSPFQPQTYPPGPAAQPSFQFQPPAQPWQPAPPVAAPAHAAPQPFAAHITRGTLQHSQALMPVHTPPPPAEYVEPHRSQASPWRGPLFLLAFAGACSVSLWLWWDHTHDTAPAPPATVPVAEPVPEVRKAVAVPAPPAPMTLEDTQAFAADAKTLVTDFFAATTPEARAACVHDAAKHSAEIEALFGAKIELRQLAKLPSVIQALPGGGHVPLFKLITSQRANGALLRLETGADGKRRLSWPLLAETHQDALGQFLRQDSPAPAWFHVAMRPSHGLDLPAELRSKYLTFDVQTSATSEPHFVACVERDTPLARFLDRESDWGKVYLSRLLVRKLDLPADSPCMMIVACEGASER